MMRELGTPEGRHQYFTAALYQFLMPTIAILGDGAHERLPGLPFLRQLDERLLSLLDAPYQEPPAPTGTGLRSGMCKSIGRVQRPPLPPSADAPVQRQPKAQLEPKPKGSTARRKRTRKAKGDDGRDDGQQAKKRKRGSKTVHFNKLKSLRESRLFGNCS